MGHTNRLITGQYPKLDIAKSCYAEYRELHPEFSATALLVAGNTYELKQTDSQYGQNCVITKHGEFIYISGEIIDELGCGQVGPQGIIIDSHYS